MMERILDFIGEWILLLPVSLAQNSNHKFIRVIALLFNFLWLIPVVLIMVIPICIIAIGMLIEDC
jgi:hypothetical protein